MAFENTLIIPIKIDALYLKEETIVANEKADFSKLPYNDGKEDVNSEFAYISENFLSQSFQNNSLLLFPGVHLHWALPDALTKGKIPDEENGKQVKHLEVPDRWIVNRRNKNNTKLLKSWVVESNYLHPVGKDNKYRAIAYPINENKMSGQPFRCMGRSYLLYETRLDPNLNPTLREQQHMFKTGIELANNLEPGSRTESEINAIKEELNRKLAEISLPQFPLLPEKPEYLSHLTAVGYGEPTFAAFYPNCHSVFGFHDKNIGVDLAEYNKINNDNPIEINDIEYEVLGLYNDQASDPLNGLLEDADDSVQANPNTSGGLTFDGLDDNVSIPTNSHDGDFTVEMWFKTTEPDCGLFSLPTVTQICLSAGRVECSSLSITTIRTPETTNYADGNWHHLAHVVDARVKTHFICVDGIRLATGSVIAEGIGIPGTGILGFSDSGKHNFFKGSVAELRLWRIVRTEELVRASMYGNVDRKIDGLLGYYKFDNGIADGLNTDNTDLFNTIPNQNHGKLNNFGLEGNASNWVKGPAIVEAAAALKKRFNYVLSPSSLPLTGDLLPLSSLCFGKLNFLETKEADTQLGESAITIGNTGTEALSAWLNAALNGENFEIEEQLEALQMMSKSAGKKIDIGPAFIEAFHEKGFSSVDGGITWELKISDLPPEKNTADSISSTATHKASKGIDILLPEAIAIEINELNLVQQQHDRAQDELISLQRQLYADWCKYLVSSYHPDIEKGLPQKDDIRFFIRNHSFPLIDEKNKYIQEKKAETAARTHELNALSRLFNEDSAYEKLTSTGAAVDRNLDVKYKKISWPKRLIVPEGDPALAQLKVPEPDAALHGLPVFNYSGVRPEDVFTQTFDQADDSFHSISCWIHISSHQPGDGNRILNRDGTSIQTEAGTLLTLGLGADNSVITDTTIDTLRFGRFWQNIYINGAGMDPFQVISWDDLPKDQWFHLYLQGSFPIEQPFTIRMLQWLKASIVQVRVFKVGLTPLELLCDLNSLGLKQMNLIPDKGPRYWQPTEPVVLIQGNIAKPGDRYGSDGELACYAIPLMNGSDPSDPGAFQAKLKWLASDQLNQWTESLQNLTAIPTNGASTTAKPWNPLLLEWRIGMNPVADDAGVVNYQIAPNFITGNYTLADDKPDLIENANIRRDSLKIFSGSTILTPHAKDRIMHVIENYLQNLHQDADDWRVFLGKNTFIRKVGHKNNFLASLENDFLIISEEDHQKSNPETIGHFRTELLKAILDGDLQKAISEKSSAFSTFYEVVSFVNPFLNEKGVADRLSILNALQKNRSSDDVITNALRAYEKLDQNSFLSQSLGGFNWALQMLHQTFQLPIADPIGFADDKLFAEAVLEKVGRESKYAPLPLFEFDPVRSGTLKILELTIIDSFGQINPVYPRPPENTDSANVNNRNDVLFARTLSGGQLSPRIAQPARLNFRWLSASHDDLEMNAHPASSPVCGWLVPDNLDGNLQVFDQKGYALGSINKTEPLWRSAPGRSHPLLIAEINNPHLRDTINRFLQTPDLASFIQLLEETLDQIDPESYAQHTELALLLGRPIAIVRASVSLEVKGNYAINQSWESFEFDLNNAFTNPRGASPRLTNGWEKIKFPVRIGEHGQLNDGVLGYWHDDNPSLFRSSVPVESTDGNSFFTSNINATGYDPAKPALVLAPADEPVSLTILMDPRGKAHATCGALPAKIIEIPVDQYKPSLKNMCFTFYTRPLLMNSGKVAIPLPDESGYSWSWLTQPGGRWTEVSTIGIVQKEDFQRAFQNGDELWNELIINGWIAETTPNKARVIPISQRKVARATGSISSQAEKIQQLLDRGHISEVETQAQFTGSNEIKEGWLKLTPIN